MLDLNSPGNGFIQFLSSPVPMVDCNFIQQIVISYSKSIIFLAIFTLSWSRESCSLVIEAYNR